MGKWRVKCVCLFSGLLVLGRPLGRQIRSKESGHIFYVEKEQDVGRPDRCDRFPVGSYSVLALLSSVDGGRGLCLWVGAFGSVGVVGGGVMKAVVIVTFVKLSCCK